MLKRDRHRCAYCGGPCNALKANRTPAEAGMPLLFGAFEPMRAQLALPTAA